jgi:hypothetical protein
MSAQPRPAWAGLPAGYFGIGRLAAVVYAIVVLVMFLIGRLTGVELVLFALIAAALLLP